MEEENVCSEDSNKQAERSSSSKEQALAGQCGNQHSHAGAAGLTPRWSFPVPPVPMRTQPQLSPSVGLPCLPAVSQHHPAPSAPPCRGYRSAQDVPAVGLEPHSPPTRLRGQLRSKLTPFEKENHQLLEEKGWKKAFLRTGDQLWLPWQQVSWLWGTPRT